METGVRSRVSPTFQSSVFNKKTYEYNADARDFKTVTNTKLTNQIGDAQICSGRKPQTAYQRQFQQAGYDSWKPAPGKAATETKPGKGY